MGGDVETPIIGGFVGSVAKLLRVRGRALAERRHLEFVRASREPERLHQTFHAGKDGIGIHGQCFFQAGFWSAAK